MDPQPPVESDSESPEVRRVRVPPPPATQPRRSRRRPIAGVLVAIDAPGIAEKPWVVDAVDINADGMGLVLPRDLQAGSQVQLSFQLDEAASFARVPAEILHREGPTGGVRFLPWEAGERLKLLEYLVRFYEVEPQNG
jgi:hypothetical protein